MKKLLLLLFFIPLVSFGQDVKVEESFFFAVCPKETSGIKNKRNNNFFIQLNIVNLKALTERYLAEKSMNIELTILI